MNSQDIQKRPNYDSLLILLSTTHTDNIRSFFVNTRQVMFSLISVSNNQLFNGRFALKLWLGPKIITVTTDNNNCSDPEEWSGEDGK